MSAVRIGLVGAGNITEVAVYRSAVSSTAERIAERQSAAGAG